MSVGTPSDPRIDTMTFPELLLELGRRRVLVRREGNDIKLRADKQALDPVLLSSLREHKPALLQWIGAESPAWSAPEAPLVELSQRERDRIAESVAGGTANIHDIYPLAPLQEGIFFHYLTSGEGDPYLMSWLLAFDTRELLDRFISALQPVIDRHDILRTSVAWEGLSSPVQVVWRTASLRVEETAVADDAGDAAEWLIDRFHRQRYRIDVRQAPLMRAFAVKDAARERWLLMLLCHHLAVDHTTLEIILEEVHALLRGEAHRLPAPLPFRTFVARSRAAANEASHETFFRQMLADVDAPTAPFGFMDVQGDGLMLRVAEHPLDAALARRLYERARVLAVSPASLFHVAWAMVLARLSGRDDVVFGTVLFGRMQAGDGASRVLGVCINTLPVRIRVGSVCAEQAVRDTHVLLSELLSHEHAPLALAQSCSAVHAPTPLFSAAFNYRYSHKQRAMVNAADAAWRGMQELFSEERGNYPLHVEVDDLGDAFSLTTHVQEPGDPRRIAVYLENALAGLVELLQREPLRSTGSIDILPADERRQLIGEWNDTEAPFPKDRCVHELFQAQVQRTPDAAAVVFGDDVLSYAELNARANRLARHLNALGVEADTRVAIALQRSSAMVVAVLATLKAGGGYVPLDPAYPQERLGFMLRDSAPRVLLTESGVQGALGELPPSMQVVELDAAVVPWDGLPDANLAPAALGLTSSHLAYVIYTSGSTGVPKGVMVPHAGLGNLALAQIDAFAVTHESRVLQFASLSFDASVSELLMSLLSGAALHLPAPGVLVGPALLDVLNGQRITHVTLPPAVLAALPADCELPALQTLVVAGEAASESLVRRWAPGRRFFNAYGPTEASVCATLHACDAHQPGNPPIGRPIANARIYILDECGRPAPIGVVGEIHIGGAGVARGYLHRPELTALRFLTDPFSTEPDGRMYKTGDLARWRSDGTIEFLGRGDHQVKIRGFRIELGEIEACIAQYPGMGDVLVLAREDLAGERRLVAYYTAAQEVAAALLREHLAKRLPEYMLPAAYVHLARLPLTPNGKVDRSALPDPDRPGITRGAYQTPMGDLERSLAVIWGQVLHIAPEEIGRGDNFFDLGGHSLRVVHVAGLLQNMGFELPVAELFSHPTIEQLARRLSAGVDSVPARGAIPLRLDPEPPPLFLVHELWGEVLYGPALVAHMEPGFSVYGLPGRDPKESPIDDFREHASHLVQTLRAVQPRGPYRIAGWSLGGVLAYEMARQLLGAGEEVTFLGLIDSANPLTQEIRVQAEPSDQLRLLSAVEPIDDPATAASLAALALTAPFDEFVQALQEASLLVARVSADQVRHYLAHYEGYVRALAAYRPEPLAMPVHLFRVNDDRDPWLGWDGLVPQDHIRIVPVPGSHQTMVTSPHVESLGNAVSRAIQSAGLPAAMPGTLA